jgi:uncharacterized protein (TIGR02265 family)
VFNVPLDPGTALTSTVQVDELLARYPKHYSVKGMFCNRIVDMLGEDFATLRPLLVAPPRGERYLPFKDYPQADYTRLVVASAAKRFPALPLSEAVRRVARDDFATFADSTMGKITTALVGDPHVALLHMPEVFARVAPGPELKTQERDAHSVHVLLTGYFGLVEYMLGQFEGIVMSFSYAPRITIARVDEHGLAFDIEHLA